MSWQHIHITRFGGPEVLELAEQPTIPEPGPGEVRVKILAADTGFTDSFVRGGRDSNSAFSQHLWEAKRSTHEAFHCWSLRMIRYGSSRYAGK